MIREWQNEMMKLTKENGEKYAKTYLRTLNNQFSAIMNYAVKYHGLRANPFIKAGSIGKEMQMKWRYGQLQSLKPL